MTRRGKGEGSITPRKDGRWEARLTLEPKNGRRQRRAFYGATRAEVAKKLRDAQIKVDEGLPLPPENLTLQAHLKTWLDSKTTALRPDTWRRYNDYRKHIVQVLGTRKLAKLSIEDVLSLHEQLAAKGLAGTTVHQAHGMLHAALEDALRWDLVSRNVAGLVKAPRRTTAEMKHLSADDARDVLEAAKGEELEAFFVVALTSGLRSGELLALRWKDVDFSRRRLRVTATLVGAKDGEPIFGEPKTENSRRKVWLSDIATVALESHRERQEQQRVTAGAAWMDYGLVFCNDQGGPFWRSKIRRHWVNVLKKAELPLMRIHDLRHSAASLLLDDNVPVKVVSEMLGHSDISTTLRIYAHIIEGAQEQAASSMDRLLHA